MSLLSTLHEGRPLVFGHRGARAYAPMNTLPAFELAYEQGAAGIELDVHLSKDAQPVIVHDFTVDSTSDGSGRVADLTLAELKALDAGGWFGERFAGTRIPTLDEVFQAVGSKLYINVEIKAETPAPTGVEQIVAESIRRFRLHDRVIVSSFEPAVLKRFRSLMPDVPLGFLHAQPVEIPTVISELTCEAMHPHYALIDARYMRLCRDRECLVNTWTVNDHDEARRLRDLGVSVLITDQPDAILKALQ